MNAATIIILIVYVYNANSWSQIVKVTKALYSTWEVLRFTSERGRHPELSFRTRLMDDTHHLPDYYVDTRERIILVCRLNLTPTYILRNGDLHLRTGNSILSNGAERILFQKPGKY